MKLESRLALGARSLGCLLLASLAGAQTSVYSLDGESNYDDFGQWLTTVGDFDGDGRADLVVPAPWHGGQNPRGKLYAYSGADGSPLWTLDGPFPNARLGMNTCALGDIDGDGVADVAALLRTTQGPLYIDRIWLVSGATGAFVREIGGGNEFDMYGRALTSAGDLDHDGIDDIAVGNPRWNSSSAGYVDVYSGATGNVIVTWPGAASGKFGWALAKIGDWDGDGLGEIAVSAPWLNGGTISVQSSSSFAVIASCTGDSAFDLMGYDVRDAGDVDGDGVRDVVATQFNPPTYTRIYRGPNLAPFRRFDPPTAFDHFGYQATGVGDVDRDGHADLAIGSSSWKPAATAGNDWGRVYLYSGVDGSELAHADGEQVGALFGRFLAPGLDVDGDPQPEFVASAAGVSTSTHISAGRVHVMRACPLAIESYCTASLTTYGCRAQIQASGTPSVSASSGFVLSVSQVEGNRPGLVFYGISGPTSVAWGAGGGYLCVKAPQQRTRFQYPGGTTGACDGVLSLDWSHYVTTHTTALGAPFSAGQRFWAQGWFRDPPSSKTTAVSDALSFVSCP